MMTKNRAPFSKYKLPARPPAVALTDDDVRILLEVYRHDIIDAKTIYTLLAPRTEDRIRRRLRKLTEARYLQRLRQVEQIFVPGGGSLPIAYTLGSEGVKELQARFKIQSSPSRYSGRGTSLGAQHVLHALEQTRFLVSCRRSAEQSGTVTFHYPDQIYEHFAPEILERPRLPLALKTDVDWFEYRGLEGTIPDGFFWLHYPHEKDKQNRFVFLEIDRGTETIDVSDRKLKTRKFWKDSSLLRKFAVYADAYRNKDHQKEFGIPSFQVLTVTTTPKRLENIQAMYQKRLKEKASPIRFLFTDFETISAHDGNIMVVPMFDGAGKERRLSL